MAKAIDRAGPDLDVDDVAADVVLPAGEGDLAGLSRDDRLAEAEGAVDPRVEVIVEGRAGELQPIGPIPERPHSRLPVRDRGDGNAPGLRDRRARNGVQERH